MLAKPELLRRSDDHGSFFEFDGYDEREHSSESLCRPSPVPSATSTVYARAGRIVGFLETKKGASHKTVLDIEQEKRNDVLREKKLLLGGFQQESQQRYSPVRAWIFLVHPALLDEAQQYGNIDELMTLARTSAHFFFPPFPKAMRGIPPGRCKLHGPGSTWKASQRLQKKLKQANKKTRLKKQPEIPVRHAGQSSEIKYPEPKYAEVL